MTDDRPSPPTLVLTVIEGGTENEVHDAQCTRSTYKRKSYSWLVHDLEGPKGGVRP